MKSRPIAVPPDTIGRRSLKLLEYEIAIVLEYLIAMVRIYLRANNWSDWRRN